MEKNYCIHLQTKKSSCQAAQDKIKVTGVKGQEKTRHVPCPRLTLSPSVSMCATNLPPHEKPNSSIDFIQN